MSAEPCPELQKEVQRLIGRCLLRLQQYEHLMKALLAHHELAGPVQELEAQRGDRLERVSRETLGRLTQALFETLVVVEGTDRPVLDSSKVSTSTVSLGLRFEIKMSPDQWAQTKAAVDDLVATRNVLVHHLIERFDVWTDVGCSDASQFLILCYDRVEAHFQELREWAQQSDDLRAQAASFFQGTAFRELVVNGIAPGGAIDWPSSGIARVLREAARAFAVDGWTRLDEAIASIAQNHKKQTPDKYGCRSWPQVLQESRLFRLEYRPGDDGRKVAWYRER